jgi:hypothetical protein
LASCAIVLQVGGIDETFGLIGFIRLSAFLVCEGGFEEFVSVAFKPFVV